MMRCALAGVRIVGLIVKLARRLSRIASVDQVAQGAPLQPLRAHPACTRLDEFEVGLLRGHDIPWADWHPDTGLAMQAETRSEGCEGRYMSAGVLSAARPTDVGLRDENQIRAL